MGGQRIISALDFQNFYFGLLLEEAQCLHLLPWRIIPPPAYGQW
jgi:hypothetical protein